MVRSFLAALLTVSFLAGCAADAEDKKAPAPTETRDRKDDPPATDPPPQTDPPAPAPTVSPRWQKFLDDRPTALRALAQPIITCVGKNDSIDGSHPAFHGCKDWHSSVHGTWALLALSRLMKDPTFETVAQPILNPTLIAQELEDLEDNYLGGEVPYGYAWFLVLARERAKAGKADLAPLAVEVATRLETWIDNLTTGGVTSTLLAGDYVNLSWPVLNLWRYAVDTNNTALATKLVTFSRTNLLPRDADCPLTQNDLSGFMPACFNRALTLTATIPAAELKPWLDTFVPKTFTLAPIVTPIATEPHTGGLNFSRSWGLYALYKATGNPVYGELYLDHMEAWLKRGDLWVNDYEKYAHWVAQFGVYAIAMTYDTP